MKKNNQRRVLSGLSAAALAVTVMGALPNADIEASALSGQNAQGIVSKMTIGWNLGNTLDSYDGRLGINDSPSKFATSWGQPEPNAQQFQAVKDAGFNTVRIPVTWYQHLEKRGDKYHINDEWMSYVKKTVDYAYSRDMFIILNVHHEEGWINVDKFTDSTKAEAKVRLQSIWSELAEEFKDYDQHLIFEGMNEPRQLNNPAVQQWGDGSGDGGYTWQYINELNATFVNTVRSQGSNANKERLLMLPGYCASSSYDAINNIAIPSNAGNVALSVHAYAPYYFTMATDSKANHNFPGSSGWGEDYEGALSSMFDYFGQLQQQKGAPIIIGEFSSSDFNNTEDRIRWAQSYLGKAKSKGIPCVLWDNNVIGVANGEAHGYLHRQDCTWYPESEKVVKAMMEVYGISSSMSGYVPPAPFSWSDMNSKVGSNWVKLYRSENGEELEEWKNIPVTGWQNYANKNYDFVLFYSADKEPELDLMEYHSEDNMSWNRIASSDTSDTLYMKTFTYDDLVAGIAATGRSVSDMTDLFISATASSLTAYGLYAVPKQTVVIERVNPSVSATPGTNSISVKWNAIDGAEGYQVCYNKNGSWSVAGEVSANSTSYTINNLSESTKYQVAVLSKFSGSYYTDYSKAVSVTTLATGSTTGKYPVITSKEVSGKQFRLKWSAVDNATAYGIACYQHGKWRVKAQVSGNVTTYTSPKGITHGSYTVVVCAKVNGSWDTSELNNRKFVITI
ncbi:MAG: cellulase family glycosylhydrolase [Ruminococcus sp.]|nr:cellulase family glycosylhydrolase [Ruminococcus sp.]